MPLSKVLLAAACLLLASCAASSREGATGDAKRDAAKEQAEGPHTLHADRLHELMRGFDDSVRTNVPEQTDEYDRWEGVFPKMADAAAALEASAIELSGHPPGKLELPDRGRFTVLARSLADAASELEEAAARGDADAVEIARRKVGTVCRDCHERFRPGSPALPESFR